MDKEELIRTSGKTESEVNFILELLGINPNLPSLSLEQHQSFEQACQLEALEQFKQSCQSIGNSPSATKAEVQNVIQETVKQMVNKAVEDLIPNLPQLTKEAVEKRFAQLESQGQSSWQWEYEPLSSDRTLTNPPTIHHEAEKVTAFEYEIEIERLD